MGVFCAPFYKALYFYENFSKVFKIYRIL